jgi:hypothetical protein
MTQSLKKSLHPRTSFLETNVIVKKPFYCHRNELPPIIINRTKRNTHRPPETTSNLLSQRSATKSSYLQALGTW